MTEKLRKFFSERKIEYFVPLAYADCRVISPHIMEREELEPRSVIVFLVPYYTGECVNMSRYAASLDYHIYLRLLGDELAELLRAEYPNARFCVYGDHSPIDERHAAAIVNPFHY